MLSCHGDAMFSFLVSRDAGAEEKTMMLLELKRSRWLDKKKLLDRGAWNKTEMELPW
jgi:hypothetical protein